MGKRFLLSNPCRAQNILRTLTRSILLLFTLLLFSLLPVSAQSGLTEGDETEANEPSEVLESNTPEFNTPEFNAPEFVESVSAQSARRFSTSDWGITRPIGIAYAPAFHHYYLVDEAASQTTNIVVVTPAGEVVGKFSFNFVIEDAINFAYDQAASRLLFLNAAQGEFAQVNLDSNGLPIASSLTHINHAELALTQVRGMTVDGTGERLLLLDMTGNAGTPQIVSVALDATLSLPSETVERTDLPALAGSDLRGLAIHPADFHLFSVEANRQMLDEITPSGQLSRRYSLAALQIKAAQGLAFAPSGQAGSAEGAADDLAAYHLLLVDAAAASQEASSTALAGMSNHSYLPFAGREGEAGETTQTTLVQSQLNGQLLQLSLQAAACTSLTAAAVEQVVTKRISSSAADVEERQADGGAIRMTSAYLELVDDTDSDQTIGLRFTNLPIPKGSVINSAYIDFYSGDTKSVDTFLTFWGEARGQAPAFETVNFNVTARPKTVASVRWPNVPTWQISNLYRTPNLAPILQEIVRLSAWENGNDMVLMVTGSGTRIARAFDRDPSTAPLLTVTFTPSGTLPPVTASMETEPVPHSGDAADDPVFWTHPTVPEYSTVIGTDKQGGLAVYNMKGREIQYISTARFNNVDLRDGFRLSGQAVSLVAATNVMTHSIELFKVNPVNRTLKNVSARIIRSPIGSRPYGICMYHSSQSGKYYAFITDKLGVVEQWELFDAGNGKVDARMVRNLDLGVQIEACVADDELGRLYVSAEDVGIWKFGAEPSSSNTGTMVDYSDGRGHLTADVEGLAIYYAANQKGYLLASSQGSNSFVIYDRKSSAYVRTFQITASECIDSVSVTDGIEVTNLPLGSTFPQGAFVVQDGGNQGLNQNFKVVSWQQIANNGSSSLLVDTTYRR